MTIQKQGKYLDEEIQVVRSLLELVSSSTFAAKNLISITSNPFQLSVNATEENKKFREAARIQFNQCNRDWECGSTTFGVTLGIYHPPKSAVFTAWQNLRAKMTELLTASKIFYMKYLEDGQKAVSDEQFESACASQRQALEGALNAFTVSLFEFREKFEVDIEGGKRRIFKFFESAPIKASASL